MQCAGVVAAGSLQAPRSRATSAFGKQQQRAFFVAGEAAPRAIIGSSSPASAALSAGRQQWRQRHKAGAVRRVTMASAQQAGSAGGKTKVLFVCLGNICRSPSAEAVFKSVVEREGVSHQFEIDSCGTGGGSSNWYLPGGFSYHEGDPADSRMSAAARTRGVTLTSRSRPLTPQDLAEFDYIIGMDDSNLANIRRAAEHWRTDGSRGADVPANYASKLSLMTDYLRAQQYERFNEVPDPYYGGAKGFELVLDLLDDACQGLLDGIRKRQGAA